MSAIGTIAVLVGCAAVLYMLSKGGGKDMWVWVLFIIGGLMLYGLFSDSGGGSRSYDYGRGGYYTPRD